MSDITLDSENSKEKGKHFATFMKFIKLRPRYSLHAILKTNGEISCLSHDRFIIIELSHVPYTRKVDKIFRH